MQSRTFQLIDWLNELSYPAIFLLWSANILVFAAIYVACSLVIGSSPTDLDTLGITPRIFDAIYYSVITATNTGYGDIVPHGISKLFAALEAFSGLFLFALFMSKLVSRRQDAAITQMHKLSFEGTFHDIREDLYVVRGDFDKLIRIVPEQHQLSPAEWMQLVIACQQIENLISEVPNFYDKESNLYRIDFRREQLLVEAFHRTLERQNTLLKVFKDSQIDWSQEKDVAEQLRQALSEVEAKVRDWEVDAGSGRHALFDSLEKQVAELRQQMMYEKQL